MHQCRTGPTGTRLATRLTGAGLGWTRLTWTRVVAGLGFLLLTAASACSGPGGPSCPCQRGAETHQAAASADRPHTAAGAKQMPARAAERPTERPRGPDARSSCVEGLALTIENSARAALGDSVKMDKVWKDIEVTGWRGRPGAQALALSFTDTTTDQALAVYYSVAWQPLFISRGESADLVEMRILSPPGHGN